MHRMNFQQSGHGPARDLWLRTLSQIPTTYGRLAYLASLRHADSGLYRHYGFSAVWGEADAALTLERSHQETFQAWLALTLEQQREDLEIHLAAQPTDRARVLENWTRLGSFRALVPLAAADADRLLFLGDFEVLIELLSRASAPRRNGSRRQSPAQSPPPPPEI